MTMTRKDYNLIAEAIRVERDMYPGGELPNLVARVTIDLVAASIADVLTVSGGFTPNGNRRFDPDRFMTACGVV